MSFKEKIDNILLNQVVGAQMVIYKDKELFNYNFGYSSLENNKKVEDETIFRIASISKIVVAMAAMKLHEDGLLDINEDISNIFGFQIRNPKFPDIPITTKMLMLHTSSIIDGYDDENPKFDNIEKGYNGVNGRRFFVRLEDLLSNKDSIYYSSNTFSDFTPGTNFIYSNFGTGILACVVEVCSKQLFTDYVEDKILKPLNLDASFRASNIIKKDKISDTFYVSKESNEFATMRTAKSFIDNTYPIFEIGHNFRGPAGGLFISMQDLSKIMQVLMNDGAYEDIRVLKKETVDLMLQMHFLGKDEDYLAKGLQLKFIDNINDIVLKGHTGSAYGVSSYMFFSREDNLGICFIANGGRYKSELPGLNNIQANTLINFIEEYYEPKNKTVKFNINEKFAHINDRKILFKEVIKTNDEVYLDLMDIASLLNVIPRHVDNKVFIKDKELNLINNKVALFELLNHLDITYATVLDNYEIYI